MDESPQNESQSKVLKSTPCINLRQKRVAYELAENEDIQIPVVDEVEQKLKTVFAGVPFSPLFKNVQESPSNPNDETTPAFTPT